MKITDKQEVYMNNFTLPFSFTLPTKIVYGPGCINSMILKK